MANLKDLLVNGNSRLIGDTHTNNLSVSGTVGDNIKIGGTYKFNDSAGLWDKGLIAGADGHDKVVATYLGSSTNGAVVGAHNNTLTAWAPINIAGTEIYFRIEQNTKMILDSSGNLSLAGALTVPYMYTTGPLYVGCNGFSPTGNWNEGIRLYGTATDNTWSKVDFGCKVGDIVGSHANQWSIGRNTNNQLVITHGTDSDISKCPFYIKADNTAGFISSVTAAGGFIGNVTGNCSGSSGSCTGNSATADKLNTDAGSTTQPVYFSGGVPTACTYTLGKSVPSDAVFTDTHNNKVAMYPETSSADSLPVLLTYTALTTSASTNYAKFRNGVSVQPSTGTLTAVSFNATSARKDKENIKDVELNATELINTVKIVDFNFKTDKEKNRKVGFIADDTDEIFATRNHDKMDLYNCIGVLMKSVQEMSAEIKELKAEIKKLKEEK